MWPTCYDLNNKKQVLNELFSPVKLPLQQPTSLQHKHKSFLQHRYIFPFQHLTTPLRNPLEKSTFLLPLCSHSALISTYAVCTLTLPPGSNMLWSILFSRGLAFVVEVFFCSTCRKLTYQSFSCQKREIYSDSTWKTSSSQQCSFCGCQSTPQETPVCNCSVTLWVAGGLILTYIKSEIKSRYSEFHVEIQSHATTSLL